MHLLPTVIKSLLVLLRKLLVIAVMSHFLAGKMLRHYIILSPTNNAFQQFGPISHVFKKMEHWLLFMNKHEKSFHSFWGIVNFIKIDIRSGFFKFCSESISGIVKTLGTNIVKQFHGQSKSRMSSDRNSSDAHQSNNFIVHVMVKVSRKHKISKRMRNQHNQFSFCFLFYFLF